MKPCELEFRHKSVTTPTLVPLLVAHDNSAARDTTLQDTAFDGQD